MCCSCYIFHVVHKTHNYQFLHRKSEQRVGGVVVEEGVGCTCFHPSDVRRKHTQLIPLAAAHPQSACDSMNLWQWAQLSRCADSSSRHTKTLQPAKFVMWSVLLCNQLESCKTTVSFFQLLSIKESKLCCRKDYLQGSTKNLKGNFSFFSYFNPFLPFFFFWSFLSHPFWALWWAFLSPNK